MSYTISPSIEQAHLLVFENNFMQLAQQKDSKLLSSPAVTMMPVKGVSNISRIGRTELNEVTGIRNPLLNPESMDNDNRRAKFRRFEKSFLVDNFDAAIMMITDPTSALFQTLQYAKQRTTDRVIIESAVGTVLVGRPDREPTEVSAADDGVITITGTTNFDYANVVTVLERNFKNNEVFGDAITFAVSANEEYLLKQEDKFINNDYTAYRNVDQRDIKNVGGLDLVVFAGSKTGVATIERPILPESGGTRTNVAMAADAIGFGMELGNFGVSKSPNHVNSWIIAIEVYFKAVRKEGVRIQKVTSTV